jgi:hypothetical protein
MKDEDIIGKEFLTVRFEKDRTLICNAIYEDYIGVIGTITNLHESFPQYARVEFKNPKRYTTALHWPVKVIKEQLEEKINKEKPEYIKDLFKEIINLTKTK